MNLVLNVNFKKNLEQGDILFFDGKNWRNLSKDELLAQLNLEVTDLKHEINKLKELCDDLSKKVKELRGED